MEIDDIAAIVKILNDNNLSHISFKKGDSKISVSKNINREIQIADSIDIAKEQPQQEMRYIVSPTIGTFYAASDPESSPFVTVGQTVTQSTVVGIAEAMKMMTNILADNEGVIAEVLVQDGDAIEYGQKLFRLS